MTIREQIENVMDTLPVVECSPEKIAERINESVTIVALNMLVILIERKDAREAVADKARAAANIRAEYVERKLVENHIDDNKGSYESELRRAPGSNFQP